jgi:RNA polymerase sigma-70 factor, ECF subfamily
VTDAQDATFRAWLADHRGLLVRISRAWAATPADQEDLLQDILLAVWRSIPSFRGEAKPSTWIYRVALHTALARRRTARRRPQEVPLDPAAPEPAGSGSANVEDQVHLAAVFAAVRALPPIDRALVVMALEGASLKEVGEVLGISANAAGVKLHRARKRLLALVEA